MIIHVSCDGNQLIRSVIYNLTTHTTLSSESGGQFRDPGLIVIQP